MGIIQDFYADFSDNNVVCYMSEFAFHKYVLNQGIIGRKDGLFVIPEKYARRIEEEKRENIVEYRREIARKLGLNEKEFERGVVKIIIPTKLVQNLHIPCGLESGCNNKWIRGGKTITGIREGVINQITRENEPELYNYVIKNIVKI